MSNALELSEVQELTAAEGGNATAVVSPEVAVLEGTSVTAETVSNVMTLDWGDVQSTELPSIYDTLSDMTSIVTKGSIRATYELGVDGKDTRTIGKLLDPLSAIHPACLLALAAGLVRGGHSTDSLQSVVNGRTAEELEVAMMADLATHVAD